MNHGISFDFILNSKVNRTHSYFSQNDPYSEHVHLIKLNSEESFDSKNTSCCSSLGEFQPRPYSSSTFQLCLD